MSVDKEAICCVTEFSIENGLAHLNRVGVPKKYIIFGFLFVWSSFGHPRVIRLYICLDYWTSDKHSKPWNIFSQLFLDKYLLPFWKSSDVIIRHDSALIGVFGLNLLSSEVYANI